MNIGIIGAGREAVRWHNAGVGSGTTSCLARDPNKDKTKAALTQVSCARVDDLHEAAAFGDAILIAMRMRQFAQQGGDDACNWLGERPAGMARSLAEAIADAAQAAHVVKAFDTTGSGNMLDPRYGAQNADMFICGDSAYAQGTGPNIAWKLLRR